MTRFITPLSLCLLLIGGLASAQDRQPIVIDEKPTTESTPPAPPETQTPPASTAESPSDAKTEPATETPAEPEVRSRGLSVNPPAEPERTEAATPPAETTEPAATEPTPEQPAQTTPPQTAASPSWAEIFAEKSFSDAFSSRVQQELEPIKMDIVDLQGRVQTIEARLEQLPSLVESEVQRIAPGIVTAELRRQIHELVAEKFAEQRTDLGTYVRDETVQAVVDDLIKRGVLKKTEGESSTAESAQSETAPRVADSGTPQSDAAEAPQEKEVDRSVPDGSNHKYQRHVAKGQLGSVYRPAAGFAPCPHCGAGDGQMCTHGQPCDHQIMITRGQQAQARIAAQRQRQQQSQGPVNASADNGVVPSGYSVPQQQSYTVWPQQYVQPQQCTPGSSCWPNSRR